MAYHSPRAIVAVSNDLITDNRVDRTCRVLQELGYAVQLVGCELGDGAKPIHRLILLG